MAASPNNPFRPGAGQKPVYLAGRTKETDHLQGILAQKPVLKNLIVTGLRGVGKTVLLEEFKSIAQSQGWLWVGNDLSESASLTERRIAERLVADLSAILAPIFVSRQMVRPIGFHKPMEEHSRPLAFDDLWRVYEATQGLTQDKIKAVMQKTREMVAASDKHKGIIFAYDEAQNLSDHAKQHEYPLSTMLDVFASLQRDHSLPPVIIILTGLPTLFPRLNEARTYTERMFEVMSLGRLDEAASRKAIVKPIEIEKSPLTFSDEAVSDIVRISGGYPYFIQYICKESFDVWLNAQTQKEIPVVDESQILNKLDRDFFSSRWDRATDRQRDFMIAISQVSTKDGRFTPQSIVEYSNSQKSIVKKGFSSVHASQVLKSLIEKGFAYRDGHGKYLFAVPMMGDFIRRQLNREDA